MVLEIEGGVAFREHVLEAGLPVLVDFWAPSCAPCKAMAPMLAELSDELQGETVVAKVNVDAAGNEELAREYRVRSLPTLCIIAKGKTMGRVVGARGSTELRDWLRTTLPSNEQTG